jgi:hypothetical protein
MGGCYAIFLPAEALLRVFGTKNLAPSWNVAPTQDAVDRRPLALAIICDGGSRSEAAELAGVGLQTVSCIRPPAVMPIHATE